MLFVNIFGLIVWTVSTFIYFSKPKEHYLPNWLVGIIGIVFILDYVVEILEYFK